jgi:UDP-glucose:(heptosyl)LPS alpha-1,3-glucosyltransferase
VGAAVTITLVHRRFTTMGGMERWLVGFARWLVDRGENVEVICHEIRDDLREEPGVRFTRLPLLRPLKSLTWWWAVRRELQRKTRPIILGFHRTEGAQTYRAGGGAHADYLARVRPVGRWLDPGEWVDLAIERRAVATARLVIANSELCARSMRRHHPGARVEVVYNGVDARRFRPDPQVRRQVRAELGAAGPVAVFLGSGTLRKGLDVAIEALPPGWSLWVAGGDAPRAAPSSVRFLGVVREPERLLQSADALVLPTRYDPFANACLEALACGIPALTTPDNGAAEVLPEPWMVQRDAAGFREALERSPSATADACRAVAERMTPERCYERALSLMLEVSG